ncbi:hypothetical protein E5676_scaffold952G00060 [Cucumis melo var. makuwa]|uniref:Uncharacterized protein n=1 Tax=Cucumis melo var. makuwa TaxID=1194695 RepID=A0A5A7U9B1_CUCMM|nr:hypothetical protein E6C27_scaffold60G001430 [Cucumis melo var. makuwa]TYK11548.1 hypothetical protein E5676_scaffold952G00060 [Cucumis melo var. makuwa]
MPQDWERTCHHYTSSLVLLTDSGKNSSLLGSIRLMRCRLKGFPRTRVRQKLFPIREGDGLLDCAALKLSTRQDEGVRLGGCGWAPVQVGWNPAAARRS